MKKLHILFCFSIVLLPNLLFGQKNDWQNQNLKGRIIQLTTDTYSARDKFGEPVKEQLKETETIWFTENGYLRRRQTPKRYNEKEVIKCRDYIYDKNKNLCCIVESEINQKELSGILFKQKDTIEIIEHIFDASNRVLESNTYDKDHNLTNKTKYRYIGNTKKSVTYDKNGCATEETTEITENRKETIKSNKGYFFEWQYDANGRIIKSIFALGGGNGIAATETHYQYNQYGDEISSSSNLDMYIDETGPEQHGGGTSYEYEYDKWKNWIVCREYTNGKIQSIEERKIVYATSIEDFRQAEAKEAKKDRMLAEAPIRAKHQADSIRYREDSIRQVEKYRADSIRHRQDSIRKIENAKKLIIRTNKNYMESLIPKYFLVSSVLSVKAGLEKVKKITINDDGTISFSMKGTSKYNIPIIFTHYYSWSSGNLKATAYISYDCKYVVINCLLDDGGPISIFNKAAILYADKKIYEVPSKVRKSFISQMQNANQQNKLLPY